MVKKKAQKIEKSEQKMEVITEEKISEIEQNEKIDIVQNDEINEEKTLPNETKDAKFIRLAQKRMGKILSNLKSLAKLSNKNNYTFTEKQAEQMFVALEKSISLLKMKFSNAKIEKPTFEF